MRAVVFVLAAAVLFGTTGTTQALAAEGASSLSVGAARMSVGGGFMALVGLVSWRRRRARTAGPAAPAAASLLPAPQRSSRLPARLAVGGAAAGMAVYQVTFFAGVRANGVAVGTLVTLATSPLWAGLFEWLFRGQRPGRPWLVSTGLAVVGVGLLGGTSGSAHLPGLLLSLTAGAAYGLELVLLKIPLDHGWHPSDAVAWVMGLAGLLTFPLLVSTDLHWLAQPRGAAAAAWLGVATIVVAYQLLAAGLKRLSAATVTTLTLAEPATAALLGFVLLNERLTAYGLAGLAAIGVALAFLARSAPSPAKP
ncbi:MAG: DMT family transporter [Propionibacteriaceae bacterium]|nr:DMT family transporter [Propionibacteriaceae bacterium]